MKRFLLGLMIAVCAVGSGKAQDEMPMPMRGAAAARLEQYKKLRLMEVLKLDEETSLRFFARYNKQREELTAANDKRNLILDDIAKMRRGNAADADYQKALNEIRGLTKSTVDIRERFLDDIAGILTPRQIAEYLVFERNFVRNVREIMRNMQRERMRGGPPR